jgi:uncharacterized protein (DUF885 family)
MSSISRIASVIGAMLLLSATPTLAAPAVTPTASAADQAFMALADHYFDTYYFPTNPTAGTSAGLHQYDTRLEDYSRAGVDAHVKALKQWEARVAAVDPAPLSERVRGDRELVLNNIRSALLTLETIRPWQKNPDTYSSGITYSTFTLMARKFAPPAERLRALIAREKLMPAVLADARRNLANPP